MQPALHGCTAVQFKTPLWQLHPRCRHHTQQCQYDDSRQQHKKAQGPTGFVISPQQNNL